jgi:hypothetical protein
MEIVAAMGGQMVIFDSQFCHLPRHFGSSLTPTLPTRTGWEKKWFWFVVSHPFRRKKRKGWGTEGLFLFSPPSVFADHGERNQFSKSASQRFVSS